MRGFDLDMCAKLFVKKKISLEAPFIRDKAFNKIIRKKKKLQIAISNRCTSVKFHSFGLADKKKWMWTH